MSAFSHTGLSFTRPQCWGRFFGTCKQTTFSGNYRQYADDCRLSPSFCRPDGNCAVSELNRHLQLVNLWGEVWHVGYVPERTHMTVLSRFQDASQSVSGRLCFGSEPLPMQKHRKILGVIVACSLHFDHHVAAVAQ